MRRNVIKKKPVYHEKKEHQNPTGTQNFNLTMKSCMYIVNPSKIAHLAVQCNQDIQLITSKSYF